MTDLSSKKTKMDNLDNEEGKSEYSEIDMLLAQCYRVALDRAEAIKRLLPQEKPTRPIKYDFLKEDVGENDQIAS